MTSEDDSILALFDRQTVLKISAGFVVALAILWVLALSIGVERILDALSTARYEWLALGCLSTLACLTAWAKAWQVVLEVAGVRLRFRRLLVTFYAATFANYVTPLGQAGGEPFIAYVLSRDTGASYEDSLASVVTADALNLLPFFTFAGVGFGALLWNAALPATAEPLAAGLVAMAIGVPLIALGGWYFRTRLKRLIVRLAAPVAKRTERISLPSLRQRLHDLEEAFGRIATDRKSLAVALAFSYVGWIWFTMPLYFAGLAVGEHIDPLLVLFIVPASTLAGLTPSPGGLGGVEAALVGLLVALAGLSLPTAAAVAVIYRVASYVFALAVGALGVIAVIARNGAVEKPG